ncbi:hypothetical protein F2Q69_00054281 [Brassica cretica]|uniref:Uncharacterized protein n=1 Tax=Brassica cretica TaxID=69181 RepID=A0A8S9NCA8_BRACR|nr:hypothetical protein F2Q69_00054281 [Brassica cretica]
MDEKAMIAPEPVSLSVVLSFWIRVLFGIWVDCYACWSRVLFVTSLVRSSALLCLVYSELWSSLLVINYLVITSRRHQQDQQMSKAILIPEVTFMRRTREDIVGPAGVFGIYLNLLISTEVLIKHLAHSTAHIQATRLNLESGTRWNRHSGCSALSRTVTRVAPLSGTVIKTVLRKNHQIALFSVSFVPAGASLIQCNSRPVMTRKGLGRLDKDLKTN